MANISQKVSHKLGANRNEIAHTARKYDKNFAQSRDIHEDRGERQIKTTYNRPVSPRAPRGGM